MPQGATRSGYTSADEIGPALLARKASNLGWFGRSVAAGRLGTLFNHNVIDVVCLWHLVDIPMRSADVCLWG